MPNESKTELIIRKHFEKYKDIVIEQQQSDNPRINKILTNGASKSGRGPGRPDFIIQFKEYSDLLIVIECKASTSKHESENRDQYRDYAVDGALLYSSYLSKEYDVISIAISGEDISHCKISHFLQVKGDNENVKKYGNKLLPPDDYIKGYRESPEKFRQDYDKLLTFSKEFNEKLHSLGVKEAKRAILISSILIALENKPFVNSFKDFSNGKKLMEFLITSCINEFESANLDRDKIDTLKILYNGLTLLSDLQSENNLQDLITSVQIEIQNFIKTHKYHDTLGQLYIEFLRYANSDKSLGIVLTPPHITEFMSELGEVNKDSVVYDSCTGTGGFLVSAMRLMIENAKDNQAVIKSIKQNQLIGIEKEPEIFSLACSNMFIHQDGKSNILNGSCFDEEMMEKVKEFKPTVGLLNPPYKSDKKNDTEELEFVYNNLSCLEQGGKCVAILPMQSALAQKGKVYEWKKRLLEEHTLESVFSMPDELFFNSKVGVVSCIMVFTAKRPHPEGKKTYFGYYKDDGFVKRKTKGRIDLNKTWESVKKKDWINNYRNKENIPGISINRIVSAKDEWCAEAYMETDYTQLTKLDFLESVKNFVYYRELHLID